MAEYTLYAYQTSDFAGGLSPEANGRAVGTPPFNLTLNGAAQMIEIVVEDNEGDFGEEIGSVTQYLAQDVTLNGVTYPAGSNIVTAYDLTNSGTGHQVTSFHIGTGIDGFEIGPVVGVVTTQPMTPGMSYSFNRNQSSYRQDNDYSNYVCFARGAHILTRYGEIAVEDLRVGDAVLTRDHGFQKIRWIGSRRVIGRGDLAPITIRKGAFSDLLGTQGEAAPHRDLVVSPQHRFFFNDWRVGMLFGAPRALVSAAQLVDGQMIHQSERLSVDYFHLLFDAHEVIFSEGVATESFHPGAQGAEAMGEKTFAELVALFPELKSGAHAYGKTAARALKSYEAQAFLSSLAA